MSVATVVVTGSVRSISPSLLSAASNAAVNCSISSGSNEGPWLFRIARIGTSAPQPPAKVRGNIIHSRGLCDANLCQIRTLSFSNQDKSFGASLHEDRELRNSGRSAPLSRVYVGDRPLYTDINNPGGVRTVVRR
jgi:hypothetical protein